MNTVSSTLNVPDVLQHLQNMHSLFNDVKDLGPVELYAYFSLDWKKTTFLKGKETTL